MIAQVVMTMAVTLRLGAVAASPTPAATPAGRSAVAHGQVPADAARQVLTSNAVSFCRDGRFPLSSDEMAWCDLLPADGAACPGLRAACLQGARAELVGRRSIPRFALPSLGQIGVMLLWAVLGLALVTLVALLTRRGLRWTGPRRPSDSRPEPAPNQSAAPAFAVEPTEHDVDRLLGTARDAADAGDFAGAVHALKAAVLRRLEADGVVRVHACSTNGEYLRAVATRAPERAAMVQPVLSAIERAQFGGAAGHTDGWWQRLYAQADALARASTPVLLMALALLTISSCHFSDRGDWDRSPAGNRGVLRFLNLIGVDARERLAPFTKLPVGQAPQQPSPDEAVDEDADEAVDEDADEDADHGPASPPTQLILFPDAQLDEADWAHLLRWIQNRQHRLVVLGQRELPAWAQFEFLASGAPAGPLSATRALLGKRAASLGGQIPGRALVRSAGPDRRPLIMRGEAVYAVELPGPAGDRRDPSASAAPAGAAATATTAGGRIIAVADDRLFHNAALAVPGNADLLAALVGHHPGATQLAGELTGMVSPNPVATVTRGRLAPFVLQLGVLLALLFVARGAAFGRFRNPPAAHRRAFVEHVEAVGLQYARAHAARHALAAYGSYVVERLRERVGATTAPGLTALAAAVAARTGRSVGDVARLILEAREPETADAAVSNAHALATLRQMRDLLEACGPRPPTGARSSRPSPFTQDV